ncbi:leukocyte receptor cluster member 1 [Polyodon spathula]|uniref:leukocyte receptor cluster member 1 n=1 Tax=Polyodon spathula TaxID=7913 RepID=UPI001B7DE57F|nr:leukocyte receptor cluster member 1 [Polyodon spathula]
MNILPKKSWHVRNKDNVARVRKDEARAAEEARERQRRVERAEQEARTNFLRSKCRASLPESGNAALVGKEEEEGGKEGEKHLDLFGERDLGGGEKRGNKDYEADKKQEQEKRERAIGLLVSLGPAPGTATPWYLKGQGSEKEGAPTTGKQEETNRAKKPRTEPEKGTEKERKEEKLKALLDPLRDMERIMKRKRKSEKKEERKSKERRREEAGGSSSLERLREERRRREAAERLRAQALLKKGNEKEGKEEEEDDRSRPYSSQYHPELSRKRQRRDLGSDPYGFNTKKN